LGSIVPGCTASRSGCPSAGSSPWRAGLCSLCGALRPWLAEMLRHVELIEDNLSVGFGHSSAHRVHVGSPYPSRPLRSPVLSLPVSVPQKPSRTLCLRISATYKHPPAQPSRWTMSCILWPLRRLSSNPRWRMGSALSTRQSALNGTLHDGVDLVQLAQRSPTAFWLAAFSQANGERLQHRGNRSMVRPRALFTTRTPWMEHWLRGGRPWSHGACTWQVSRWRHCAQGWWS